MVNHRGLSSINMLNFLRYCGENEDMGIAPGFPPLLKR